MSQGRMGDIKSAGTDIKTAGKGKTEDRRMDIVTHA